MSGNFFFSCSNSEKEEACEFILLFLAGEKLCRVFPWKTTLTRSRTTEIERRAIHCLVDVNGPGDRWNDVFLLGERARARTHASEQEGETTVPC
jgi:hypothetical protein